MKLWTIPWPWDYHGQGELVVMAEDQDTALRLAQEHVASRNSTYGGGPRFDKIAEHDGPVYENGGCDC